MVAGVGKQDTALLRSVQTEGTRLEQAKTDLTARQKDLQTKKTALAASQTELEQTVTLPESAAAPVRQGDALGTLTVTQNGETLLEVPIRAAETVEKLTFGEMFLRLARTMCFCG